MLFQWLALPRFRFKSTAAPSSPTPESIPPDVLVDEEIVPGYDRKAFYKAHPGEVLDGRYKLKAKIGWGSSSTVWLAEDTSWKSWLKPNKYAALKINTCDNASDEDSNHELDMAKRIGTANPEHRGRGILCMATEAFSIQSPTGSPHLCLAFEPMRDPLWLFRRRVCGDRVTRDWLPMFKVCIQILIEGLDYLHSECKVVHTDLKLDNIMMTFENESVIEAFVQGQAAHPMARKVVGDHVVYRCHNNFGDIAGRPALKKMYPKITDFGLAQPADRPLLHPIQPDHCHAPEVLLGTSWSYPADIWNFGIMVWDLLAGRGLFQDDVSESKPYNPAQHLAEMIAILGPVPEALVQREREMRHWRWSPEIRNREGKLCGNAAEYFGGPFFADNGEFVQKDLIPLSRRWADEVPECIPEQDRQRFLAFMRRMLCWLPGERATAKELKEDPWFDIKL
ncbi:Kinase domain-containing protein [Tolypocladium paradoxum]|uniref:non-specific serine/threonine protein kinase n=1 Tax=Tolypocladium paradoxum TaxID=94208 RepID=A0A2S4L6X6_9HYPO|nr:Kinase domain-containing protein [Tolypocladium paradoxum]